MIIATTKAPETVISEDNTTNSHHQHHQSQRKHSQVMTPATVSIVCLIIVASVVIGVSETAATGGEAASVSCGTAAGQVDSGNAVIVGGGSPLREGRSSQDAEKLRSLLRMKPAEKARCRWQAEECNPYTAACCQGMRCANYMGGFCMASYEKCICFPSRGPEDNN